MIKQYPHTITFTTVSGGALDADGNWVGGTTASVVKNCRAEINSRSAVIATPGGTQIIYDWIVYMPLPQSAIEPNTMVEIKNGARVLSKSTVKQFSEGQLNARLWV